jgi:hypothetical protein
MAKTDEEIRKMAADPNWAKKAQAQVVQMDKDFPGLKTPERKLGIGPPPTAPRKKVSAGVAAQVNGLMNVSEKKQLINLLSEDEKET